MADGLCEESQGRGQEDNIKMKTIFEIASAASDHVVSKTDVNSEQTEFYINGESGDMCSKFGATNVVCVSSESGSSSSFTTEFNNLCQDNEDNDDNCRKKRCADRYDSSESSDSGVAVHGCSDCSGSLSSGNSDIADPGSPYSTSSDDSTAFRTMPPVASPLKQAQGSVPLDSWTWSGASELLQPVSPPPDSFPAAPITASKCNKRGLTVDSTDSKRQKPEQTLLCVQTCQHNLKKAPVPKTTAAKPTKVEPREKITQYFKPQKQPDGRRLSTDKISKDTSDFVPFLSALFSNKGSMPSVPAAPPDKTGAMTNLGVKKEGCKVTLTRLSKRDSVDFTKQDDPETKSVVALCTRLEEKSVMESPTSPKTCTEPSSMSVTAIEDRSPSDRSQTPTDRSHVDRTPSDRIPSDRIAPERSQSDRTSSASNRTPSPIGAFVKTVINEEKSDMRAADGLSKAVTEQLTVTPPEGASIGPSSPILSLPKTIRFPVQRSVNNVNVDNQGGVGVSVVTCQWTECVLRFETSTALLEHLQLEHVNTQTQSDLFVCLWTGCKVYGRSSCSRSWLEGHVLSHVGKKPFRCIVDGCGLRFSSQVMLERHVNWHFKQAEGGNGNGTGPRRSIDTTPNKLFRRNGKKLRYRRHPWSARVFDYFDTGVMEQLQHRLLVQAQQLAGGDVDRTPGSSITLHSRVIGRKMDSNGISRVLVRWFPRDVAPDEWMTQKDVPKTRVARLKCSVGEVDNSYPLAGSTGSSPTSSSMSSPSDTPVASRSDTPVDSCLDSEEDSMASTSTSPLLRAPHLASFGLLLEARTSMSAPRVKQRRKPVKAVT